jgi:hypothetical protein
MFSQKRKQQQQQKKTAQGKHLAHDRYSKRSHYSYFCKPF